MTGANEKYTTKRYINVHIAFIIQKSKERVWHVEKIFENVGFPKETRQNLPFIEKYVTSFHMYISFGINLSIYQSRRVIQ